MPPLTRHTHYAALPVAFHGRGHAWTKATALTALSLYLTEEGRMPRTTECRASNGLPSYETVRQLFGSLPAWLAAVEAPPVPARSPSARRAACLNCGRLFESPDVRRVRICDRCHALSTYTDGCWMTGQAVPIIGEW